MKKPSHFIKLRPNQLKTYFNAYGIHQKIIQETKETYGFNKKNDALRFIIIEYKRLQELVKILSVKVLRKE